MTNWWRGDIVANDMTIHYTRTGGDGPTLVLAHGMADSGLCWSRVAHALEAEYDIIMPDARSHGRSSRSVGDYSFEMLASDLAGLIEVLSLERPVVGGHSMGAMTAVFLAASRPELVRATILEDPPFWPVTARLTEDEVESRLIERRRGLQRDQNGGREALLARGRADNPLWADEEFEPWVDSKMEVDTATLPRLSQTLNWREALSRMEAPTLLITGDPECGAIITPEIAREAREIQPLMEVVRISGAGHSIRREQFEQYLATVRGFLAIDA
jgi:N-formylmaleamate deformylase